jgi:hypothetical protein
MAGHTHAERDVTGGITDWSISMTVTTELDDVVA